MPQDTPKKYTVKDTQSGKTITFQWNDPTPPTDADFEQVFQSAGIRTQPQFQTAAASSTATTLSPNQQKPTIPLESLLAPILRTGVAGATGPGGMASYVSNNPSQAASDVGTAAEIGLPLIASPLPPVLRIPASGALQGTGTLIKGALENAAAGGNQTSLGDQFKRAGLSALTGMFGQAVGEGVGAGLQKAVAPFAGQVDQNALAIAKRYGINPFPSEVINETTTGSNVQKLMEDVSSRSLMGAAITKKQRYGNFDALLKYKSDVLDKLAPETKPTALKNMVTSAVENNEGTFKEIAQSKYAAVDDAINSLPSKYEPYMRQSPLLGVDGQPMQIPSLAETKAGISTAKPVDFARRVLESIPEKERIAAGKGGTDAMSLVNQLERVAELPANISFKDAQFYRSQLMATVRSDSSPIGGQIKGTAAKISDLFDSEMNSAAKAAGSDVYDRYRAASEFWKQGKDLFNSDVVAGLAKQDPEALAKFVFSPASGENIGTVQKAIDPNTFAAVKGATTNDTWQRFKRAGLETLIDSKVFQKSSQATGDEYLRGANLYETLKGYGSETLNAWLNPGEKDAVMQFAKMASRINTKEPTIGLWGMAQLNTAALDLVGGAMLGEPSMALTSAGIILGGPAMYAKLITSPTGRKLLTEGYKLAPGTRDAINFASRVASYIGSGSSESPSGSHGQNPVLDILSRRAQPQQ